MVKSNEEFQELHLYYTTRRNNPLKKKQSLIVLCCKLIRIIYGISIKGFHYDGQKLLGDIKSFFQKMKNDEYTRKPTIMEVYIGSIYLV